MSRINAAFLSCPEINSEGHYTCCRQCINNYVNCRANEVASAAVGGGDFDCCWYLCFGCSDHSALAPTC
ncbi:13709_t:CDS:2 [Funneliformis mosseae]|uniref:13709_t:CDS:1 n=1 Tax=Funneliformis mosseae TaxID=27381 RepID=A0A9N9DVH7_FUNMO|nr:13709_t:CDS:2 [Funneliformis mosseae]